MNKFLFASMAVLCIFLSSCSKEELRFTDTYDHEVAFRASEIMTVNYTDTSGTSHSIDCTEASLSYINSSTIKLIFTYVDGSTQTDNGNDIDILPISGSLRVSTSSTNNFTTFDFDTEACRNDCCYSYNNGNNVGTALNFIIEDEPGGF